jgi:hydrogenase-1 operon protein HyaE
MNLHPLVERLCLTPGAHPVSLATLDAFVARGGDQVLFFSGDPLRFPQGLDVAVVLPELRNSLDGRFEIGVVLRDDEDAVAQRFGACHWPSLVFLRDGHYVATVAGMKDWDEYRDAVAKALQAPASRAPTVGIPVLAAGAPVGCR